MSGDTLVSERDMSLGVHVDVRIKQGVSLVVHCTKTGGTKESVVCAGILVALICVSDPQKHSVVCLGRIWRHASGEGKALYKWAVCG